MKSTYLEAKSIINGKPFDEIVNLPKIDKRFSYGTLNGSEGEGLVDLNFKDILVTVRNNNGVATIVNYEQYDANGQFTDLVHTNESKTKKNTVKLNEAQLRKIVAESVKKVLSENRFHSRNPFETSDAEANLKNAIEELKEAIIILEEFRNNGMNEKRLLEMAQAYGERGMRFLKMSADSAM